MRLGRYDQALSDFRTAANLAPGLAGAAGESGSGDSSLAPPCTAQLSMKLLVGATRGVAGHTLEQGELSS